MLPLRALSSAPPITAATTRTVLPPLEVEVVAGNFHRTVHPGTNAVSVDLQPSSAPQEASEAPAAGEATAARVTSHAAERLCMSADTVRDCRPTRAAWLS
jgi:hypothetical protein